MIKIDKMSQTISCRNMTDDLLNQFTNHQIKEKMAITFFLKKNVCLGGEEGSRKVQKNSTNITFFQTPTRSVTINLNDFSLLCDITPFVSFTILTQIHLNQENLYNECDNDFPMITKILCKKFSLLKIILDHTPHISIVHKMKHPVSLISKQIRSLARRNLSPNILQKLKSQTFSFEKRIEIFHKTILGVERIYSIYNFLCLKLFYSESPSLLRDIHFGINDIIDLYMWDLPSLSTKRHQIIQSLIGENDLYIEQNLLTIDNIESNNIKNIQSNDLSNLTITSRHSILARVNYSILTNFVDSIIKKHRDKKHKLLQFLILDATRVSEDFSKVDFEFFTTNNTNTLKKNKLNQDKTLMIDGINFYLTQLIEKNLVLQGMNKNVTYYSMSPISSGLYGKVYNMSTSLSNQRIRKKEKLKKSHKSYPTPVFQYKTFMKIIKEYLLQYYLYEFSQLENEDSILRCFPRILIQNIKLVYSYPEFTNIISNSEKINGIDLYKYLKNLKTVLPNFIYNILLQLCDILIYYQKHYQFVHGDLHLQNIMIQHTTNKLYIIDFGRSSIKIPILLPPLHGDESIQKKSFYLIDFLSNFTNYSAFEHDFKYNDINHAKAIDLLFFFYRLLDITSYYRSLNANISKLIELLRIRTPCIFEIRDDLQDYFPFYSERIKIIQKSSSITNKEVFLRDCNNQLPLFYPENFKQIVIEAMNSS